jgi:hypothetical protein
MVRIDGAISYNRAVLTHVDFGAKVRIINTKKTPVSNFILHVKYKILIYLIKLLIIITHEAFTKNHKL